MHIPVEKVSFVLACSRYFGKGSKTLKEFNDELKALTPADRAELSALFPTVGFVIMDVAEVKPAMPTVVLPIEAPVAPVVVAQ